MGLRMKLLGLRQDDIIKEVSSLKKNVTLLKKNFSSLNQNISKKFLLVISALTEIQAKLDWKVDPIAEVSHSTPKYSEDKEWNNDRGANFDGVIQIFFFIHIKV